VVIASTSDRPAVERLAAAYAAHSIAEAFRDQGRDVLLMMDSLTRFCQAQREIGLAAGEPPSVRGFPPSAFALLPRLLERSGTDQHGSITGIYTVLVEGDDESEPVADNSRAILDGHLFLSRRLAGQAIYPAIDPMLSISRLQVDLLPTKDYQLSTQTRELWGEYERIRDLVEIGAYQQGSNPIADRAIRINPKLREFIRQNMGQSFSHEESTKQLAAILGEGA
jgi:flagellum-specific ATP synthase